MRALGCADTWVNLVMLFVRTVKYIFRHNGRDVGSITPTRGLRQGDPITPYLFLLCAEGLSSIINDRCRTRLLHGCKIARLAPIISHLFFADDSFLFFQSTKEEAMVVKDCLAQYEKASGQVVSFAKSSIIFSPNTDVALETTFVVFWGFKSVRIRASTWGLPLSLAVIRQRFSAISKSVLGRKLMGGVLKICLEQERRFF